jgi:endonuclease/exonuclease/phosphatase family metal-dependent hydrolase
MGYNLMHYPGTKYYNNSTHEWEDRTPVLREILATYHPDIFSVCEIEEAQAAAYLLENALNYTDNTYDMADFVYNQSGGTDLQQMLFYNKDKLQLTNQDIITTNIRDINHYTLRVKTPEPLYIEVFVAHLKSSQGENNEYKRLQMVQEFTSYLESLPQNRPVIFMGDLNLYTSSEPAYQELLDPGHNIVLQDPENAPGDWHNNYSLSYLHTQSSLTDNSGFQSENGGSDGVTGGLDDRFDFILLSNHFFDNQGDIHYLTDSYSAYGNNADCFNNGINDTDCTGDYSQYLRDLLSQMSDHIPVVLTLETEENIGVSESLLSPLWEIPSRLAGEYLHIKVNQQTIDYHLINPTGQILLSGILYQGDNMVDITSISPGIYYLTSPDNSLLSPLVFIKNR